jgi:hypothetical protein
LSNDSSDFELELTWLKEHPQPYDLGECEFHLALRQMILIWRIKSTKKWAVSALKILKWVSILLRTRTVIGWKFCRDIELYYKQKELRNTISQLFYVYASSSFYFETIFLFRRFLLYSTSLVVSHIWRKCRL